MLARNWRCALGEVDLIIDASQPGGGIVIVFVEVKARADDRFGSPALAVGAAKQRTVRRVAARWLAEADQRYAEVRFDVVAVTGVHVEVIEAAF